jgi:hypothetical protein
MNLAMVFSAWAVYAIGKCYWLSYTGGCQFKAVSALIIVMPLDAEVCDIV